NTATRGEWWHSLGWCGLLAVAAACDRRIWARTPNGGHRPPLQIYVLFALLLVPLAWMVVRYFTFLGFAAAVVAAGLMTRRIWWRAAVVAAAVWQLIGLDFKPLDRVPVVPQNYRPLVAWINGHTPTNAVLLASISESPVLLAHTGRPIVLHSKFENRRIRERYQE